MSGTTRSVAPNLFEVVRIMPSRNSPLGYPSSVFKAPLERAISLHPNDSPKYISPWSSGICTSWISQSLPFFTFNGCQFSTAAKEIIHRRTSREGHGDSAIQPLLSRATKSILYLKKLGCCCPEKSRTGGPQNAVFWYYNHSDTWIVQPFKPLRKIFLLGIIALWGIHPYKTKLEGNPKILWEWGGHPNTKRIKTKKCTNISELLGGGGLQPRLPEK